MKKKKPKSESSEQIRLVGRIRHFYPDTVVFAIPNGGGRSPMEATRLKEEGVLSGVSDLFIMEARDGWFGLFIEMKRREGGSVSDEQRRFMKKAKSLGYKCIVAHGCEEGWKAFEEYMTLAQT